MATTAKTTRPLAQAPLSELTAELKRRTASLPKLLSRRQKLVDDIGELDQQIEALEQLAHGHITQRPPVKNPPKMVSLAALTREMKPSGRRGKGGGLTLRQMVGEVLNDQPMRPKEIAETLVQRGLHPGSKSLHIQVSQVLGRFEEFNTLSRGQWIKTLQPA
ncbi:MAG: hypothetical protein MK085_03635 [Phycisphaerales bacterium]|nr:hypothetical protein [Phycisphaerales bacterium]